MKSSLKSENVKVLPLGSCGGVDAELMYGNQRRELARRGDLMKGYISRGGREGNGQQLDAVLRAHLGLDKPTE